MDSRAQVKPAANLLREGLRGGTEACPEPEIFAAYSERSLDAEETARWELHFSRCADCRERLAAIAHASDVEAAGLPAAAKTSPWAWLWDWRTLAPVAAMLIVGAIWIARTPSPIIGRDHALVAMSSRKSSPAAPAEQEIAPQDSVAPAPPPKVATPARSVNPSQQVDELRKQSQFAPSPRAADKKDIGAAIQSADSLQSNEQALSNERTRDAESSSARANLVVPNSAPAASPSIAGGHGDVIDPGAASGAANRVPSAAKSSNESTSAESRMQATTLEPTVAAANSRATVTASEAREKTAYSPAYAQMTLMSPGIISTPDPVVQWRIGEAGFVERTTNGGNSWQGQQPEQNAQLVAGSAPSARICWLVGNNGVILVTKDAKKWKRVTPPVTADFTRVVARNENTATVTTSDGHSFATSDAGDHWQPVQR